MVRHALVAPLEVRLVYLVHGVYLQRRPLGNLLAVLEKTATAVARQQVVDRVEARIGLDPGQRQPTDDGFDHIAVESERVLRQVEFCARGRISYIKVGLCAGRRLDGQFGAGDLEDVFLQFSSRVAFDG